MSNKLYTFSIPSPIIIVMYNLMMNGIDDVQEVHGFKGTERGGHFCYTKNDTNLTVELNNFIQADLMPETTSLNSGDFPFTFHTHPIVIKLDTNLVDNYPNLISDDDLIGSIIDNYYCKFLRKRNICNTLGNQKIGGINFFDILAVPYGLFVYRPNPNIKHNKKLVKNIIQDCKAILDNSIGLLPHYELLEQHLYFDTTNQLTQTSITTYITLLNENGFLIDFIPWEYAKTNGIIFENMLPVTSHVDNLCMC